MTRHITDQPNLRTSAGRLRPFLMFERRKSAPSVLRQLQQRPRIRRNVHIQKYLRIARGHLI